jgi:hypothetical protein
MGKSNFSKGRSAHLRTLRTSESGVKKLGREWRGRSGGKFRYQSIFIGDSTNQM